MGVAATDLNNDCKFICKTLSIRTAGLSRLRLNWQHQPWLDPVFSKYWAKHFEPNYSLHWSTWYVLNLSQHLVDFIRALFQNRVSSKHWRTHITYIESEKFAGQSLHITRQWLSASAGQNMWVKWSGNFWCAVSILMHDSCIKIKVAWGWFGLVWFAVLWSMIAEKRWYLPSATCKPNQHWQLVCTAQSHCVYLTIPPKSFCRPISITAGASKTFADPRSVTLVTHCLQSISVRKRSDVTSGASAKNNTTPTSFKTNLLTPIGDSWWKCGHRRGCCDMHRSFASKASRGTLQDTYSVDII